LRASNSAILLGIGGPELDEPASLVPKLVETAGQHVWVGASGNDCGALNAVGQARSASEYVRPASGPADEAEPLEPERVGELSDVVGPADQRTGRQRIGAAVAGTVDGDNAKRFGMRGEHTGKEEPRAGRAVEEQNRLRPRVAPLGVGELTTVA
jgi:hypothetical protein